MTNFPALINWDATRDQLNAAAAFVTAVRKACIAPQPNAGHLQLVVTLDGLSTGVTPSGELTLGFDGTFTLTLPDGEVITTPTNDAAGVGALRARLETYRRHTPGDFSRLDAIPEGIHYPVDAEAAPAIGQVYQMAYSVLARVRGRLRGTVTPLGLWSHHFDISGLWFPGNEADEYKAPHTNLGFAPYSDALPRPYFYMYAWPMPDGLTDTPLTAPARWFTGDWTGAILDYDALRESEDPARLAESSLSAICDLLTTHLATP